MGGFAAAKRAAIAAWNPGRLDATNGNAVSRTAVTVRFHTTRNCYSLDLSENDFTPGKSAQQMLEKLVIGSIFTLIAHFVGQLLLDTYHQADPSQRFCRQWPRSNA